MSTLKSMTFGDGTPVRINDWGDYSIVLSPFAQVVQAPTIRLVKVSKRDGEWRAKVVRENIPEGPSRIVEWWPLEATCRKVAWRVAQSMAALHGEGEV